MTLLHQVASTIPKLRQRQRQGGLHIFHAFFELRMVGKLTSSATAYPVVKQITFKYPHYIQSTLQ